MSMRKKRGEPSSSSSSLQPFPKRFTRSSLRNNQSEEEKEALPEASSSSNPRATLRAKSKPKRKRNDTFGTLALFTVKRRPSKASAASTSAKSRNTASRMTSSQPIVLDDSDDEPGLGYFDRSDGDGDLDMDDDIQAAITASLRYQNHDSLGGPPAFTATRTQGLPPPSPALTEEVSFGSAGWKRDFMKAKSKYSETGDVEGYAGMIGTIEGLKSGDADDSMAFKLGYDDIDGREQKLDLEMVFQGLKQYPASYKLVIFSSSSNLPKRAETTFTRFTEIYDLEIQPLLEKVLASLQGDDEATGGVPPDFDNTDVEDEDANMVDGTDPWAEEPGRGFEVAKGSSADLGAGFVQLKDHFEQAKIWGYRPGLTQVSDFWYWLGVHPNYKPRPEVLVSTTRGHGIPAFYLSAPLLNYLKSFGRCYKLRTAFGLDWKDADSIGLDEELSRKAFQHGELPKFSGKKEKDDPVAKGFERNVPLVAFHWVIRRFMEAPKYCLNCGSEVSLPALRPYVCDKPLCIYGFMSLGLGPSVEHTIITHPAVVDILLSFAHCAASSEITTRMELPLHLHIEVPIEFGIPTPKLIDDLSDVDQRTALAFLIEKLPKVSQIKTHLEAGRKLKSLDCFSGSIGVLRWVIGSCRAYLKETKLGEGVQQANDSIGGGDLKQFTFVVGSPEQEQNFKEEIEKAKKENKNCRTYSTLLAFHGSGTERWHNILRTGLDFNETANGRAYGHGVYFASDSTTSMGAYARATPFMRENADFRLSRATALVELVNVPHTFVSSSPFYVVNNVKQIKPFLLLVQGTDMSEEEETYKTDSRKGTQKAKGDLFIHDPLLKLRPRYSSGDLSVRMPEKLTRTKFVDKEPNDQTDHDILHPPKKQKIDFKPSPQSRFHKIQLLPPPKDTSVVASKAIAKELKAIVKAQAEGDLPFWINPDVESLYSWILELHTFPPDSHLHQDLKKHNIKSIIAEIRFPASFPHSPPFMRIIHPRMMPFMHGGGGNITGGGSVCNELMTATGWNPAFCTEAIVRAIMTNMTEAVPPAKLDPRSWDSPYTMREAVDAYKRVAKDHGWAVPIDFDKLTM
ncbi:uncharacterized protein I303_104829 [Kwoniella dejecticola CBS 10117]|uniref:UBC core domain-containing protein n=1 Tax=Kwoniella dejecticola CBS 10117 TaxID=1296121 RepID=A0AAJ8KQY5_9TREE